MNETPRISLIDTLNVIQLARETALSQGNVEQADRFRPLVNEIRNLVNQTRKMSADSQSNAGVMGQDDFKCLLAVAQSQPMSQSADFSQSVADRNQMILAMSAANMTDLEIARQMEITREEVNLVLKINGRGKDGKESL
jgi:hypothetical protein